MLPDLPKIYYIHCPSCHKVGELLLEDLERTEDTGVYKYGCECGLGQTVSMDDLPRDEREAFKLTVEHLKSMNHTNNEYYQDNMISLQGHISDISERYMTLRLSNTQINTMVFIVEKNVRDIIKMLEKDDKDEALKHAMAEAQDLLQYLLKEQDKATNNGTEIEKKASTKHWSDLVQEIYNEDEQEIQAKDS